ncbi:MAG TPA: RNA polymerase sigma factor [Steroidobacteraceae bacterium]|jgi:RNA polymerase sigma-70 factor (ECF subfamily)|nr:RNA polymerase sigma factor [Steroidobacteraceae bacterium]
MAADAFAELLRPHLPALHRLAYRFTGREADAEDLVQECLTRLYARGERLMDIDILRPWLARALYNLHVDRSRSLRRTPFGHLHQPGGQAHEEQIGEIRPDPAADPDLVLETDRLRGHLAQAVEQLPEDQRLVVLLHDVEGYELREAASILGIPVGTAKSRLHRAHGRLRERLRQRNLMPANIVSENDCPAEPSDLTGFVQS